MAKTDDQKEHIYPRGEFMSEQGYELYGRPKKIEEGVDWDGAWRFLAGIIIGMVVGSIILCLLGRASCSLGLPFWWK